MAATLLTSFEIPKDAGELKLKIAGKTVELSNLQKIFWPKLGLTKRDLLAYYATIAPVLLPHLKNRAMVMKRYPNGAGGNFFFMKRAPDSRPDWIETCPILHRSGKLIHVGLSVPHAPSTRKAATVMGTASAQKIPRPEPRDSRMHKPQEAAAS